MVWDRKDPLAELLALREKMNDLFEQALLPEAESELECGDWRPDADVFETAGDLIFCIDLPGVDRGDIEVAFEGDSIRVKGKRDTIDAPSAQYHRVERPRGRFSLRFPLPAGWDAEKIEASQQNGVLRIRVPRLSQIVSLGIEVR